MQKKRRKREQGKWQESRIDKRVKKGLIEKFVNGSTGNVKKWKKEI